MLKLGNQGVSGLYLGETKIKKAYLGNAIVFEAVKPSRLPAGYTEVEYIQKGTGTAYFTVPAASSTVAKITLDMHLLSGLGGNTSNQGLFGSGYYNSSATRTYYYGVIGHYSSGVQAAAGTIPGSFLTVTKNVSLQRMLITMDLVNKYVSCNSDRVSITSSISETARSRFNNKCGIFNCLALNTNATTYPLTSQARIYSFRRETSAGVAINELVPCISPTGVVGLYDLARNSFLSPTGTFTAGPAV